MHKYKPTLYSTVVKDMILVDHFMISELFRSNSRRSVAAGANLNSLFVILKLLRCSHEKLQHY